MKDRKRPYRSDSAHFTAIPSQINKQDEIRPHRKHRSIFTYPQFRSDSQSSVFPSSPSSSSSDHHRDFTALPNELLTIIAASFGFRNLQAASLVCKSWRDGLQPLREAMVFLRWGKRFRHGRGGVRLNLEKALNSFLKGAALGSTLAMVDAGLLYWELGRKEQGVAMYLRAAELGDPTGQCNLGISYLQADPPNPKEAIKWLHQASVAGYARAQYQLALCLHQGCASDRNLSEAAKWYLRAAEGGYVRAMYNTSLCYSYGEGLVQSHRQAKIWMKKAAQLGHRKAQLIEHWRI